MRLNVQPSAARRLRSIGVACLIVVGVASCGSDKAEVVAPATTAATSAPIAESTAPTPAQTPETEPGDETLPPEALVPSTVVDTDTVPEGEPLTAEELASVVVEVFQLVEARDCVNAKTVADEFEAQAGFADQVTIIQSLALAARELGDSGPEELRTFFAAEADAYEAQVDVLAQYGIATGDDLEAVSTGPDGEAFTEEMTAAELGMSEDDPSAEWTDSRCPEINE
jgi:hypothetical protein